MFEVGHEFKRSGNFKTSNIKPETSNSSTGALAKVDLKLIIHEKRRGL